MSECTIPTTTTDSQEANVAYSTTKESTIEPDRYVTPAVDIYETETGLRVVADLPGLTSEDIDVNVEKDVLTIKGVTRQAPLPDRVYAEFEPVNFYRQFTLGKKIDQTGIAAEYKNGVLNLQLPFAAEVKPRRVEVRVG